MGKVKESGTPTGEKTFVRVIECRTLTEEEAAIHAFEEERVFTDAEKALIEKVFSKFKFSKGKSWGHYKQGYNAYSALKEKFERQIMAYQYYLYRVKQGDPVAVPVSEPSKEFSRYIEGIMTGYRLYGAKFEEYSELSKIDGLIKDDEPAIEPDAATDGDTVTSTSDTPEDSLPEDTDLTDGKKQTKVSRLVAFYMLIKKLQKAGIISKDIDQIAIARFIIAIIGEGPPEDIRNTTAYKVVNKRGEISDKAKADAEEYLKPLKIKDNN